MTNATHHHPPRRLGAGRIAALAGAVVAGVLALGLLAGGGVLLWADAQRDREGFVSTAEHGLGADTRALVTDHLDVDGAEWIGDDVGAIRLRVTPRDDRDVFVGIAPTAEVSAYLAGVAHTEVSDVELWPFRPDLAGRPGGRRPERPALQGFWAASAQGGGTQTLTWDVADGNWSVVVMNVDGSPGVHTLVSAGARVPHLDAIGWGLLGGGVLALLLAGGLAVPALGRPSHRPPGPAVAGPAPAAS